VISGEDPAAFPKPLGPARGFHCSVNPDDLVRAIEQVRFAAAHEDDRPALTGVLFQSTGTELTIVATDGNRLAERRLEIEGPKGTANALVSARPLGMLSSLIRRGSRTSTMAVVGPDRDLSFTTAQGGLSIRLLQNKYPDYSHLISQRATTQARVPIAPLLADLQSIAAFAQDEGRRVEIRVGGSDLSVGATNAQAGHGRGSMPASVTGQPVVATVNVIYLIDALRAVDDLEVEISFNGPNKPVIIRPVSGTKHVNVVMPIHSRDS
jgi:DNA polymerase-3 subunit beta